MRRQHSSVGAQDSADFSDRRAAQVRRLCVWFRCLAAHCEYLWYLLGIELLFLVQDRGLHTVICLWHAVCITTLFFMASSACCGIPWAAHHLFLWFWLGNEAFTFSQPHLCVTGPDFGNIAPLWRMDVVIASTILYFFRNTSLAFTCTVVSWWMYENIAMLLRGGLRVAASLCYSLQK